MAYWERYSKHVIDLMRTMYLRSRIYKVVGKLKAEFFASDEPVPFAERLDHAMKPIEHGEVWSSKSYGCAWFHFSGKLPAERTGKHFTLLIDIGGEGCLYSNNGCPIRGITDKRSYISGLFAVRGKQEIQCDEFEVSKDGSFEIWLDAGCNNDMGCDAEEGTVNNVKFAHAWITEKRDDINDLFYDYSALAMAKAVSDPEEKQIRLIANGLNKAFLYALPCTKKCVQKAKAVLAEVYKNGTPKKCTAYAVGHSHLDLGFMWPIRETRRKFIRTMANQLKNIEKFPGYVFGLSQPQLLEWLESDSHALFLKVKNALQAGKIAPMGGMWVEADMNVTSGESLIRQCFYGRQYWRNKIGVTTNVCWLPDTFGYNGNLPQILKKSGMNYFVTTKLNWLAKVKFPYHSFTWKGIDGSSVLAHMPPEDSYSGEAMPTATIYAYDNYTEKDVSKNYLMVYGIGDGGGGPNEGHIEFINRQDHAPSMPKVVAASPYKFFKALEKEQDKLPIYSGELYLEKHQGTYTTRSDNKKCNRQIEIALHNLEFISAVAFTKGYNYPKAEIDKIWKEVLLYQFHDILPGSSVSRVYKEAAERYKILFAQISKLEEDAIAFLQDGEGSPTAVNMSPYPQKLAYEGDSCCYLAEVEAYSSAKPREFVPEEVFDASDDCIESEKFKVVCQNGKITSIYDKAFDKELCEGFMNELNVYSDHAGKFDAWDLEPEYYNLPHEEFKFVKSTSKKSATSAYIENYYAYNQSTIKQRIVLEYGKPYVNFFTEVDWHEDAKMLRADFRPSVYGREVTCDIQFGSIKRSTEEGTREDKAKIEICAHKYIDIGSDSYKLSLLSNHKYGWRVKNGLISLNLLKGSNRPAKHADHGKHTFSYAIFPHAEKVSPVPVAYAYNQPVKLIDGNIGMSNFVAMNTESVTIETIKVSEDSRGIVVRAYENKGESVTAELALGFAYKLAFECDCLEENRKSIDITKPIDFKPFEIKTFLFVIG